MKHGPWTIGRGDWRNEWTATHDDYDASWEGEEDGWVSNGLHVTADTLEDLMLEIEEVELAKGLPVTLWVEM